MELSIQTETNLLQAQFTDQDYVQKFYQQVVNKFLHVSGKNVVISDITNRLSTLPQKFCVETNKVIFSDNSYYEFFSEPITTNISFEEPLATNVCIDIIEGGVYFNNPDNTEGIAEHIKEEMDGLLSRSLFRKNPELHVYLRPFLDEKYPIYLREIKDNNEMCASLRNHDHIIPILLYKKHTSKVSMDALTKIFGDIKLIQNSEI